MGIRMVRQPSQTPNVTNIDDIIPFRYAYGDQDGYVIGKGNEISYTIDGSTFRVNSGRVVLQGVETDIDANGVSFTIDNASETRYFVVYYEVNLATQTTAIKLSNYSTSGFPTINAGDDLTANSSGIARLSLYRFTATNSVISNVTKIIKAIQYTSAEFNLMSSSKLVQRSDVVLINDFSEYKGKDVVFVVDGIEVTRSIYTSTEIFLGGSGVNRSNLLVFGYLTLKINSSNQLVGSVYGLDYQGKYDNDLELGCRINRIFVRR